MDYLSDGDDHSYGLLNYEDDSSIDKMLEEENMIREHIKSRRLELEKKQETHLTSEKHVNELKKDVLPNYNEKMKYTVLTSEIIRKVYECKKKLNDLKIFDVDEELDSIILACEN
jgi:hypothetical protein